VASPPSLLSDPSAFGKTLAPLKAESWDFPNNKLEPTPPGDPGGDDGGLCVDPMAVLGLFGG
jgi:hypothetical protein